ncbi:hypothetical protein KO494_12940 [Lacinutrix sp. C3R15]|nr:hypothetical protein [Lacinutrix sp. C3R15]
MLLFLVKLGAIDANGLNFLFSGNEITFVKPNCKKKNSPKLAKDNINVLQTNSLSTQMISLDSYCTSQFQFQLFSWDILYNEPFTVFNEHFSSKLSFRYLEHIAPPPRLV